MILVSSSSHRRPSMLDTRVLSASLATSHAACAYAYYARNAFPRNGHARAMTWSFLNVATLRSKNMHSFHSIRSHGLPEIPLHVVQSTVPAGKLPGLLQVADADPPALRHVSPLSAITVPVSRYLA